VLVLTRKVGEQVRIGDGVTVRVLGVRGGQVSLGFIAPKDVRLLREEVSVAIERENRKAALDDVDHVGRLASLWKEYGSTKK